MNDILSSIYKFFLDAQLAQWQIVRISTDWQKESITFKSMHRISERDYRRDCFHLYWRSYPKNRFIECVNHNNGFGCNSFPFADIYQNQASGEEQIRITNLQKMMQDSNEIATCTIKIGFTEEKLKRRDYRQYNTKINVESISLPNSVTEIKENPSNQNPNNNQSSSKVYSNAYDGYINIRDSSTSKGTIIGKFKNGPDGAICLSQTGEWTKINYKGVTGYVYTKYLSDTPTEEVTLNIDGNWLKGIWRNAEEQYAYLIFNNGTFALQSASGTLAYGTYMLKGNDIEFNIKQFLSSMEISKIKRFRIDSSSDEIGPLRKQSFINNTEMYANSDGLTWTESQYLALRDEICKLMETGVSTAKTESFTRTCDVRTERTETLE